MKYAILIQAGTGQFAPKTGWDAAYPTRQEAEEAKDRAEQNAGWAARVISMTDDEASELGW